MYCTYTNIIKMEMNSDANLGDCIQDGGTTIPRLVSRLVRVWLSLSLSLLPPADRQRSRISTVFGNVLCADSVTPCRAPPPPLF
jgi:hypothetical protein